ncbi:MAG: MFS transporter [Parvularculales bacterium]
MSQNISSGRMPDSDSILPAPGHRLALLLLFLAFALSIADRMILTVLFEPIKAEFGLTDTQLGFLGGFSFAVFYATLSLPIARMADRANRSKIVFASLVIFSITAALCGLATSFLVLVIMRIGVGIGEAGVNPASQSILGDYYPPKKRASAMSILSIGANVGMIFGFVVGGMIAEEYGWRAALIAVALPGLFLAIVIWFKLKEPQRGYFDKLINNMADPEKEEQPSLLDSIRALWNIPSYRQLLIGSTIAGTVTYGMTSWVPTFYIRVHDLTQSEAGLVLAGIFGVVGAAGAYTGGKLVDRLSRKGFQYGVWMIAASKVIVLPLAVAAYLLDPLELSIALYVLPIFVSMFYLGPIMALIQTISPLRMRATASSLKMLALNLVGMSTGPLMIGAISDYLEPSYGDYSLRIALAVTTCLSLWAAYHFFLCGKALAKEFPKEKPSLPLSPEATPGG